jgi:uncharacterized membrane protein YeaQ/YmgE (transglycosylase-associated protein family)
VGVVCGISHHFGLITGRPTYFEWSIGSFVVAVIGAVALLFILRLVRRA